MKQFVISTVIILVLAASVGLAAAKQTPQQIASVCRFSAMVSVPAAGSAPTATRLEIKDWALADRPTFQIPVQGFYVAQLRGGTIIAKIAGKSEKHQAGDFWTVQAGQTMAVVLTMHCKVAQLRTIAISPR
jgi:hypothetical protein